MLSFLRRSLWHLSHMLLYEYYTFIFYLFIFNVWVNYSGPFCNGDLFIPCVLKDTLDSVFLTAIFLILFLTPLIAFSYRSYSGLGLMARLSMSCYFVGAIVWWSWEKQTHETGALTLFYGTSEYQWTPVTKHQDINLSFTISTKKLPHTLWSDLGNLETQFLYKYREEKHLPAKNIDKENMIIIQWPSDHSPILTLISDQLVIMFDFLFVFCPLPQIGRNGPRTQSQSKPWTSVDVHPPQKGWNCTQSNTYRMFKRGIKLTIANGRIEKLSTKILLKKNLKVEGFLHFPLKVTFSKHVVKLTTINYWNKCKGQ